MISGAMSCPLRENLFVTYYPPPMQKCVFYHSLFCAGGEGLRRVLMPEHYVDVSSFVFPVYQVPALLLLFIISLKLVFAVPPLELS